jgi:DNA-binding PucR family transcriptional regulator
MLSGKNKYNWAKARGKLCIITNLGFSPIMQSGIYAGLSNHFNAFFIYRTTMFFYDINLSNSV